jgi:hypothetical protein
MICHPNYADSATITGSPWTDTLPVTNIQTPYIRQMARTTGVALMDPTPALPDGGQASAVINIDFGRLRYLTAVSLTNHNLSRGAMVRLVLWSDATRSTVKYDFGWQPVWPRWFDTMQLRWADSNFWYGQITDELIKTYPKIFLQMLNTGGAVANATSVRYASIYLEDTENINGYIDIGRLFAAEDWTPKNNMLYGAGIQWVDPSVINKSLDGTKYMEKRTKYRQVIFQLKYMKPIEGVNKALLLTQQAGITGEVLYIFDPSDLQLMQQRSFVGTLSELSPLEWWMFGRTSMAFKIEEAV